MYFQTMNVPNVWRKFQVVRQLYTFYLVLYKEVMVASKIKLKSQELASG